MSKQIKIRIFPNGQVQAEVEGIKGKKCTDYMKLIEEILEADIIDSEYTPEYFETIETEQTEITENERKLYDVGR